MSGGSDGEVVGELSKHGCDSKTKGVLCEMCVNRYSHWFTNHISCW